MHLGSHRSQSAIKIKEEEGAVAEEEEEEEDVTTTNQTHIGDLTFSLGFKLTCHVMLACVFAA